MMKRQILLFLTILLSGACFAQRLTMDKVPPAAAQAFKMKFPNGSQPGWAKADTNAYEVQFFNGKKRQSALFDASGKWLQTQSEINYGQVPAKVQNAFGKEFEDFQVQEVYETELADKTFTYEISAFKGRENYLAVFSAKGELLKKEVGEGNE
jgi:hypothetical protein